MWDIKQGDLSQSLHMQLRDLDGPINLTGRDVWIRIRPETGAPVIVWAPAVIVDADEGRVRYDWRDGETDVSGRYSVEAVIDPDTMNQVTCPSDGFGVVRINRSLEDKER